MSGQAPGDLLHPAQRLVELHGLDVRFLAVLPRTLGENDRKVKALHRALRAFPAHLIWYPQLSVPNW